MLRTAEYDAGEPDGQATATLNRLRLMSGCIPLVAIVGDTRGTGATRGLFFHSVAQLPGKWLGNAPSAGAA